MVYKWYFYCQLGDQKCYLPPFAGTRNNHWGSVIIWNHELKIVEVEAADPNWTARVFWTWSDKKILVGLLPWLPSLKLTVRPWKFSSFLGFIPSKWWIFQAAICYLLVCRSVIWITLNDSHLTPTNHPKPLALCPPVLFDDFFVSLWKHRKGGGLLHWKQIAGRFWSAAVGSIPYILGWGDALILLWSPGLSLHFLK